MPSTLRCPLWRVSERHVPPENVQVIAVVERVHVGGYSSRFRGGWPKKPESRRRPPKHPPGQEKGSSLTEPRRPYAVPYLSLSTLSDSLQSSDSLPLRNP